MTKRNKLVIGTRGSKLALWQTEWIKSELQRHHPDVTVEIKKIKTTGDMILDVPLAQIGGKGLFVKEIEEALLRGDAHLAVHSMKDVPTYFPKGLHLAAICKREDPRDAFITGVRGQGTGVSGQKKIRNFRSLPEGASIGTSSLRRSCQLLNVRPDLKIIQLRGNLDTRLRKLDEGLFDAIILACAGVKRLGWAERITEILEPSVSLPAIGQGAIGIECSIDNEYINRLLFPLNHPETAVCVQAERAFLKKLEGGCQVPIAAYARLVRQGKEQGSGDRGQRSGVRSQESGLRVQESEKLEETGCKLTTDDCELVMDGLVGNLSGDILIKGSIKGRPDNAENLGLQLAEDLLSRGAGKILAEIYKT